MLHKGFLDRDRHTLWICFRYECESGGAKKANFSGVISSRCESVLLILRLVSIIRSRGHDLVFSELDSTAEQPSHDRKGKVYLCSP